MIYFFQRCVIKLKRNGYQEFEERENLKRAKQLNLNLIESIDSYNKMPREDLEKRIEALRKVIQCFEELMEEAFDVDENAYAKFRDKLNYLEFRKDYIEKYGLEEYDINEVRKEAEERKKRDKQMMKENYEEIFKRQQNNREENGEER